MCVLLCWFLSRVFEVCLFPSIHNSLFLSQTPLCPRTLNFKMFLIWAIMSDGAETVSSVYIYMAVCLHFLTEGI